MVLSALLHWLISQSIFVAVIETYKYTRTSQKWERYAANSDWVDDIRCGFSPLAIIIVIALGVFMILVLLAAGSRKLKTGMPLVASCSGAIAAACHIKTGEDGLETSRAKVQWGVTNASQGLYSPGHCAFAAADVQMPQDGEWYK
jgi:hypothetical protein